MRARERAREKSGGERGSVRRAKGKEGATCACARARERPSNRIHRRRRPEEAQALGGGEKSSAISPRSLLLLLLQEKRVAAI